MSGGVEGLFLVISHTFPIYKQLSTQGTITSCSLNKLDVKNHWVLRDLENPQALSSALAALRRYSPGPSSFLNPVEPWFLTSNYYLFKTLQHKCCRTPGPIACLKLLQYHGRMFGAIVRLQCTGQEDTLVTS